MQRLRQNTFNSTIIFGIIAISTFTVCTSSADTVWTFDGSKIVGTVKKLNENKVLIETEFAGILEVDFFKVQAIDTDSAVGVAFKSGDQLVGTIDMTPEKSPSEMQTAFGTIGIKMEDVTAIWPAGEDNPQVVALKQETEEAKEAAKPDWSARVEAGITRAEGNHRYSRCPRSGQAHSEITKRAIKVLRCRRLQRDQRCAQQK